MSQAIALMQHLVGQGCSREQARALLGEALELEVDPLDYCVHRLSLESAVVAERAAQWTGLEFSASPSGPRKISLQAENLDRIAALRTLRSGAGQELLIAPDFLGFLKLRTHLEQHPELRQRVVVVPIGALRARLSEHYAPQLMLEARTRLARAWPRASAHLDLTKGIRQTFVACLFSLVALVAIAPFAYQPLLFPVTVALLLIPASMRWLAAFPGQRLRLGEPKQLLEDAELPIYSVLIPLRDEAHMVPQMAQAMLELDYPREKLDIKFVVEAASARTVAAVRKVLPLGPFELIAVPDQRPRTKPKAMNYALPLVRGSHVVVYDAEDIPDPGQLRLAASWFAAKPELDCLQAELVIDNAEENWLTALFAGEYAGLFGLMLPALARWKLPMPLGGTSNHFNAERLRALGGWDAFNVTEDADLGVRMARRHYRTATLVSQTREEAPVTLKAWMKQRTRWMKGWMQTFIVHNRNPRQFLRDAGWRGFLAFQVYVGSLIVSALLHSVFLLVSAIAALVSGPGALGMDSWGFLYVLMLAYGYSAALTLTAAGIFRLGKPRLLAYQLLLPVYWVLHGIATIRAALDLLHRPFHWSKTVHGQSRLPRTLAQAVPDLPNSGY